MLTKSEFILIKTTVSMYYKCYVFLWWQS